MRPIGWIASKFRARAIYGALAASALWFCAAWTSAAPAPEPRRPRADLRGSAVERLEAAENARRRRSGAPAAAALQAAADREANPQVRYRLLQGLAAQD